MKSRKSHGGVSRGSHREAQSKGANQGELAQDAPDGVLQFLKLRLVEVSPQEFKVPKYLWNNGLIMLPSGYLT